MLRLVLVSVIFLSATSASAQEDCWIVGGDHAVASPPSVRGGEQVIVTYGFRSRGSIDCGGVMSQIEFLLSHDRYVSDDDLTLGTARVETAHSGTHVTYRSVLRVPASIPPGGYQLLVVSHYSGPGRRRAEGRDGPLGYGQVTIRRGPGDANVRVSAARTDTVRSPSREVRVHATVENTHTVEANDIEVGVYLVRAGSRAGEWMRVGTERIERLGSGESSVVATRVSIPEDAPDGRYSVRLIADDGNQFDEYDEVDNARRTPTFIVRDNEAVPGPSATEALRIDFEPVQGGTLSVEYWLSDVTPVHVVMTGPDGQKLPTRNVIRDPTDYVGEPGRQLHFFERPSYGVYTVRIQTDDVDTVQTYTYQSRR